MLKDKKMTGMSASYRMPGGAFPSTLSQTPHLLNSSLALGSNTESRNAVAAFANDTITTKAQRATAGKASKQNTLFVPQNLASYSQEELQMISDHQ